MGCAAMYTSPSAAHILSMHSCCCRDRPILQQAAATAKAAADAIYCAHHHCVGFATAGDTICKYGTIDAIHRRLHNPLTCAFVHLHGLRQSAEGQQAVSNKLSRLTACAACSILADTLNEVSKWAVLTLMH